MSIRLRILTLLLLLSATCIGTFLLFEKVQGDEEAFGRQQREKEIALRLQRLVGTTTRPAYRYLRNYSGRTGMVDFLATRDPMWAERYLKGRMDLYRIDMVWVLQADGTVIYGLNRPNDSALTSPPLPADELRPLFQKNDYFSFHEFLAGGLYQIQGMPVMAATDLDRRTTALGWLVVAKHWGQPVLEDLADAGQGRVMLTGKFHQDDTRGKEELEAWVPLPDHKGQPVAGLDYHVQDAMAWDPVHERIELSILILNSVGAILLVGVLLPAWILRPFSLVRTSLLTHDSAPLASLLHQKNEFGQMARVVQASLQDRKRLEQSLDDRLRLGRELHDGAIQGIYGAGMALSRVRSLMERDLPAAHQLLDATQSDLNRIISDLRDHIERADPRPTGITFGKTVAQLIQQTHGAGPITTEVNIDEALAESHVPLYRSEILRFVREAISNATRHGGPSRLVVSWQRTGEGSTLLVSDDGVGFDPESTKAGGRGLGNLSERALSLGGRLEIHSQPNHGTCLRLKLPPAKPPA